MAPSDLTLDEARQIIANLTSQVDHLTTRADRLTAENQGLYERIEKLEETNREQEERLAWYSESDREDNNFWDEWGTFATGMRERILELEARVVMLSRSKGTGIGRGRPADWTARRAEEVRALKEGGMSYRDIAEQTGLSLGQVQRILKPPPSRPVVTREDQEDRLARIALDTKRFIAAVERQKKQELQRRLAQATA